MYIRKIVLALILVMSSAHLLCAQGGGTAPLGKGEKQLNFGLGFSDNGLPVYVSFDFAVHKDVTLTPEFHVSFHDDHIHAGSFFKADYHWNYLIGIPSNWDFYAGLRAGFEFHDHDGNHNGHGDDDNDDFHTDFGMGAQVGGRWYWSERWGMNLEFSGGTGFGAIFGLSVKL